MSTNCPSPLSIVTKIKDRASRNIVGVRELAPEILKFMEQLYIFLCLITLFGSIMVISSINPIHSVF